MNRVLLSITLSLFCLFSQAQEQIYTQNEKGELVNKEKFVEAIYFDSADGVPNSKRVMASSNIDNNYVVKCNQFDGWDVEAADFQNIEILYQGKCVYSADSDEGWNYFHVLGSKGNKNNPFYMVKFTNGSYALCFTGAILASQAPYLTIVMLKNGKATLVHNVRVPVISVSQLSDGSTRFDIQDDVDRVDFVNGKETVIKGVKHTLTFKDGMVYFQ